MQQQKKHEENQFLIKDDTTSECRNVLSPCEPASSLSQEYKETNLWSSHSSNISPLHSRNSKNNSGALQCKLEFAGCSVNGSISSLSSNVESTNL